MTLFEYRELIKTLVVSDLKVKYANSILGFAWSLLNPLMMMLILYFVFSNVFASAQDNFILYILTGLLAWRFFMLGTTAALNSIVGKPSLITKIYVPREILTLSTALSALVSSTLEFVVLLPLLVIFGVGLHPTILAFPLIHLLYFALIYGVSLILASLYVYFRDLNQIWDVVLQLGVFASPVMYPISLVPESYLPLYMLNPVTCIIGMYRDVFLSGTLPGLTEFAAAGAFALAFLAAGTATFQRLSRRFAEEV
jgi:lipopolysaccharide transport system permease protein